LTVYFFDSSALTKYYVTEPGTAWVTGVIRDRVMHRVFIAQVTPVEIISAVSRLKREGRLPPRTAQAIRLLLNRHVRRRYDEVIMVTSVVERACDLLEVHPLRAYAALQLASALEINARLVRANLPSLIFVTADASLLAAAKQQGLQTENPN
jgi:hypothetical protein